MTNGLNKDKKKTDVLRKRVDFENACTLVKVEVDRILSTSPLIVRQYMEHLTSTTGKQIRAVSLLACAMDSDDLINRDAVKFAAAIELIHLATLVHDDVIDNAEIRRGKPSLQKKYGKRTAVICGDYLLSVALKTAADVEDKEDYLRFSAPDYMGKVCLGELYQHVNNGNYDLSVYRYLKIIAGKTAALFEASFHGGAMLCTDDVKLMKKYAKMGKYIGMIFQLTDDCMDYETTEQVAKKPVKSDYEQKVITLPLIHAFNREEDFRRQAKSGLLMKQDVDRIITQTGGLAYTRFVAKKYYNKALKIIEEIEISNAKREIFLDILDKAYRVF
ncbi:MAG: polyprenyl synthetase family protein [Anaerovoracaceae bacterium]